MYRVSHRVVMHRGTLFLATVAIAVAATVAKDCRASVPAYDCGGGSGNCLAMFNGCYHSKSPKFVLPRVSLVNLRGTIDWQKWTADGNAGDLIIKCAKLAVQKNKQFFGVEFYGECYFGDNPDLSQPKVTTNDGCDKFCGYDVGGADAMVLYRVFTP